MVFGPFLLEVSLYGLIGGAFTESFWTVVAITLLGIMGPVWFGVHKEDPLELRVIFHVHIIIVLVLYTFLGIYYTFLNKKNNPILLLNADFRTKPRIFFLAILFLLGIVSFYLISPDFLPEFQQLGYPLSYFIIGTSIAIGIIHYYSSPIERVDLKYLLIIFIILWPIPAAYTHMLFVEPSMRPWQGILTLIIIPVAFFFAYVLVSQMGIGLDKKFSNERAKYIFFLELGVYVFIIWAIGFGIEETTSGGCIGFACSDPEPVYLIFYMLFGLWLIGLIILFTRHVLQIMKRKEEKELI